MARHRRLASRSVVKGCGWRQGCPATIASAEAYCLYHLKVAEGLITSTRSFGKNEIVRIELTSAERAEAGRRMDERYRRWSHETFEDV